MNDLKRQALNLRLRGYSYNEINKKLNIPKPTLSGWLSKIALSKKALNRLKKRSTIGTKILIKRNKMQTALSWERVKNTHIEATEEIQNSTLLERDLLLIGTALYWGEGYKKLRVLDGKERAGHVVSLTNSDPDIARAFVLLLNRQMKIPLNEIQLCMRLYDGIDEQKALKYWLKVTGLPHKSVKETTYLVSISSKRKRPFNRLPYGTVQIRMNNTQKFHRIMGWIEWMRNYVLKMKILKMPE